MLGEGKEVREFDGREYLMERGLTADFAIVNAWKGDRLGNLVYRKTARNFNPLCATAGKICIAEVENLVEVGELDPDLIHTPGIYVDRIVQGEHYEKWIEKRTTRPKPQAFTGVPPDFISLGGDDGTYKGTAGAEGRG